MAEMIADTVELRAQVALTNSPFYELRQLLVEQRDGTLLISGCVSSFYYKQLAQEVVRSVCANIEINNTVSVVWDQDKD
jgi:hypothetical protein